MSLGFPCIYLEYYINCTAVQSLHVNITVNIVLTCGGLMCEMHCSITQACCHAQVWFEDSY